MVDNSVKPLRDNVMFSIHKQDAVKIPPLDPEAQRIYNELRMEYGIHATKKEYAKIIKSSLSTVDHYLSKGYGIPSHIKLGTKQNSKVLFLVRDIAEFLAERTIQNNQKDVAGL